MTEQAKNTSHQELLALWQQKFQEFITDPTVTKAMLNNHKAFQDYLHGLYQQSPQPNSAPYESAFEANISNDGNVSIHELAKCVKELEQRLAKLEQRIHGAN